MIEDPISEALEMVPMPKQEILPATEETKELARAIIDNVDDDVQYARSSLKDLIEKGTISLNELLEIASQAQTPRAYEVVAILMKTITAANKELLEVNKIKAEIRSSQTKAQRPGNVTNNLVVTTHDLQKLLNKTDASTSA